MEFCDALRYLRGELGLTQMELANALRVNYATVSRWELGKTCPNRSMLSAIMDYARAGGLSAAGMDGLERAAQSARRERLGLADDAALSASIVEALLRNDYETIALIDAATGQAHAFVDGRLRAAADGAADFEARLRAHCVDDDVDRVIRETELGYVRARLETQPAVSSAYSLMIDGRIVRKRVLFCHVGAQGTHILRAIQNLTETYRQGAMQRARLAAATQTLQEVSGLNIARYDLKTGTFYSNCKLTFDMGYGEVIENVPEEFIGAGHVAPDSIEEYRSFYADLRRGIAGGMNVALEVAGGAFHWVRASARLVYDENKAPYQAVIVFKDVEEERERAVVYEKWRQSIAHREPGTYTLFRCNLSKGASFDRTEGELLTVSFNPELTGFNERTAEYAARFVHMDDFDAYTSLLNSENLLASYYRGTRTACLDYRERLGGGETRWLHLTVEMAQYPLSSEIEVFLLYELSDAAQMEAPAVKARIDADPLTGVLNRRAFKEQFDKLIDAAQPDARHALILADMDGFKRVNENFGHAVGDQALTEIARALRGIVGEDGILGRLGGDVFLIALAGVSLKTAVERKATRILATLRRDFSVDIQLTASMGIAFYPDDGRRFDELYANADLALLTAKANGRDSFAFYGGEFLPPQGARADALPHAAKGAARRRFLLLVDDDAATRDLLGAVCGDKYHIDACADADGAIARMRGCGLSLAAVLLNMELPRLDAFALLERIRGIGGANGVPVIALAGVGGRERALSALRRGASDFVLAPIDADLLRVRIDSVVSRAENERLRAQNAYLQARAGDAAQFRAAYENTDTVVVEYDWTSHSFVYDPFISKHIYGRYDDRSLWQIFMADMVADARDVKAMQTLIIELANSRERTSQSLDIQLKTPSKRRHWFAMKAFKRVDDRNLPSKIILTFQDVNEDILASKKLRFLAEHDSLTGLYNRDTFLRLAEARVRCRAAGAYVLLSCDINDFRFVNERYGREEGDRLLQYAAERLLAHSNALDGIAGRLSSDVYAVLLPNQPGLLEKIGEVIPDFFKNYPLKARITGRVGAYIVSDPEMKADSMLDMAAAAKESIRGKFAAWLAVYDDSMNEKRLLEKRVTDRMETALAEGQFDVYIQPQFHHATGKIVGAEALVRWIDPERGVVPPGEFIPVFEKNGFISRMDAFVWERVAQCVSSWMARGHEPVPISVNVSREDVGDPALCEKLLAIVSKYNIPIQILRLEITESLFAEDSAHLAAVMNQLHEAGFLIEMDDFGSGYSSLNLLKDVAVDVLKLDMKFFSGNDNLGRGGMIISAVLRMSRWLNIPVIAEGVELREQADFLLSVGCPTIQGYFYERPVPVADFERMLLASGERQIAPPNPIETTLDAHSFWNPRSADSQLFNHYIGPAAVFEYHDGAFELLRVNARFLDSLQMREADRLPTGEVFALREADRPRFKKAVLEVIYSGRELALDLDCVLDDARTRRFAVTLRLMAKSSDRALLFAELSALREN